MVINFSKPTAELRRRAVHETWHADIVAALDVEQVVVDTAGCSFAELAEAKKLLVMHFAEVDRWDWPWALRMLRQRGAEPDLRPAIGFSEKVTASPEVVSAVSARAK